MKKTLVVSCIAVASAVALSAQTSVWKISSQGNTIYLGGTCHMLRLADFPLPREFDAAYAAAQELWFETDIARLRAPETQQLIMGRGTFGAESSLQKELSSDAWTAVEKYCASAGLPLGQINRFRPWLFSVTVATIELQKLGATDQGVDVHFHQRASGDEKATRGLEAFEQHLEFLVTLGAGQENEMVIQSVQEAREIPQIFERVVAAWRAGDLSTIDALLAEEIRRNYPKVFAELIVKRNQAWLPQIDEMLKSPPVEFVLVGVGHLSGQEGLVAELQSRGYTVEQFITAP